MSSKKLNTILDKFTAATATGQNLLLSQLQEKSINTVIAPETSSPHRHIATNDKPEKITAIIPSALKEEIRRYIRSHKGETEKTVMLKALKLMGFNIPKELLFDQRTQR